MTRPVWAVVAMAQNRVIGASGDMPWQLSTDLKRFKAITLGKPMIMGRKTFESIGMALPGRTSIVVTRDTQWQAEGVVPVSSLDRALEVGQQVAGATDAEAVCIVGGGQIYAQAMPFVDRIYLTEVQASPEGDTVFPEIDPAQWREVTSEFFAAGEKDSADTVFKVLEKRQ